MLVFAKDVEQRDVDANQLLHSANVKYDWFLNAAELREKLRRALGNHLLRLVRGSALCFCLHPAARDASRRCRPGWWRIDGRQLCDGGHAGCSRRSLSQAVRGPESVIFAHLQQFRHDWVSRGPRPYLEAMKALEQAARTASMRWERRGASKRVLLPQESTLTIRPLTTRKRPSMCRTLESPFLPARLRPSQIQPGSEPSYSTAITTVRCAVAPLCAAVTVTS